MALLFADTPDYYAIGNITRTWTAIAGARWSVSSGNGRQTGKNAIQYTGGTGNDTSTLSKTLTTSGTTAIVAFAYRWSAAANQSRPFLAIANLGVTHITLLHNYADNTLAVYRGGSIASTTLGTLLGTSTSAVSQNTWYWISLKVVFSDTVGEVDLDVNGENWITLTSQDTNNAGVDGFNQVLFGGASTAGGGTSATMRLADIVICDGSGSYNTTHPGDSYVLVDLPDADGGVLDFSTSSGSTHYTLVDEADPNDDTDYVVSTGAGDRETFGFPDLDLVSGSVRGVITRACAKLAAAGAGTLVDVVRSSSTNYDGSTSLYPSDGAYAYFDTVREVDPATTSQWTIANINAAEFGVKRQA